ncbi:transposase family protein [Kitasatospora sp. NPDC096128]|uniref:transposase family protein n=1 Tax=Kitasatospora sp. NPDC096128 TaxID=3155547 RepID=UPI00332BECCD
MLRLGRAVRIAARCSTPNAPCPACGSVSARVHSRYVRRLADTAIGAQATAIDLLVRRFACVHAPGGPGPGNSPGLDRGAVFSMVQPRHTGRPIFGSCESSSPDLALAGQPPPVTSYERSWQMARL